MLVAGTLVDVGAFSVLLCVSLVTVTDVSSVCVGTFVDAAGFAGLTFVDVNTFLSVFLLETFVAGTYIGPDGVSTLVISTGFLFTLVDVDTLVVVVLLVSGDTVALVATQGVLTGVDAAHFLGGGAFIDVNALLFLEVVGISLEAGAGE